MSGTIYAEDIDDTATNRQKPLKQGLLGATIAATVRGLFAAAGTYVWDATNSLWRRALGDTSGRAIGAAHDDTTVSDRIAEIDPTDHHDQSVVALDDSGQGDGTEYAYFDLAHRGSFSVQIDDTPGVAGNNTYTLELTNDDDGTAPAGCTWDDETNTYLGSANFTTSVHRTSQVKCRAKYGRIKRVRAADGGNTDGGSKITVRVGE